MDQHTRIICNDSAHFFDPFFCFNAQAIDVLQLILFGQFPVHGSLGHKPDGAILFHQRFEEIPLSETYSNLSVID